MTDRNEEIIKSVHEDNVSSSKLLMLTITGLGILVLSIGTWLINSQAEMGTQIHENNAQLIKMGAELKSLTTLMDQNLRLTRLERASEISSVSTLVSKLETQMHQLTRNDTQQWPRLRAHGENVQILKREIEKICKCVINLKVPEKF